MPSRIPLVYAGYDYWDRTRPLIDGRVQPEGIDLTYLQIHAIGELFRRMCQYAEFEASEMSISSHMAMISRGDDRFVGIPVFPSRYFRHGYVFVNSQSGIEKPQDLVGKRIGVPEYQMTAAVWVRAFLEHDYGVRSSDIAWFEGGLHEPGYSERLAVEVPRGIQLSVIGSDTCLVDMLLRGELDAVTCPTVIRPLTAGDSRVRRLFSNYREVEKDYYRRTGFFPIMHMVVVRRDVYERHRWIPTALMEAFETAKALVWSQLTEHGGALPVPLPWLDDDLEELRSLFGAHPFPYGFAANQAILEALTQYSYEQGLSARKLDPEELFCRETLADTAHTS